MLRLTALIAVLAAFAATYGQMFIDGMNDGGFW